MLFRFPPDGRELRPRARCRSTRNPSPHGARHRRSPEVFRIVFVMREIEELSVEETAGFLNLPPATVKTRLHRARRLLRQALDEQLAPALADAFPFDGMRCTGMADRVLERLGLSSPSTG